MRLRAFSSCLTARYRVVAFGLGVWLCLGTVGCKDLAGTQSLPAGIVTPSKIQTASGAAAMAVVARVQFQNALSNYIPTAGELTDELTSDARGPNPFVTTNGVPGLADILVDARELNQNDIWNSNTSVGVAPYGELQQVRALASQAIGGLAAYAPTTSANERGELYALMGYAEVMLADLFCSGVPLTTLDYHGDFTYQPGSTTQQVYTHAIALFDTAQMLAVDSAPIVDLAKVGAGRAYLALGQYAAAGQAVQNVPLTFQYVDSLYTCDPEDDYGNGCPGAGAVNSSGASVQTEAFFILPQDWGVSDREGGNGLPFVSSGDPRTASVVIGNTRDNYSAAISSNVWFPSKYRLDGISTIVVASGLEAQLITAEADLNGGNAAGAFSILNALRAGNAATASMLPPLTDPGSLGAELDTLFTERAAWLFADGHRQGDLRRLVRQYEHAQNVPIVSNGYPLQSYPGLGAYGTYIDVPIPSTELYNPLFSGCLSRD